MKQPFKSLFIWLLTLIALFFVVELILNIMGIGSTRIYYETQEGLILRKPGSEYLHQKENKNIVYYNNFGFHDSNRSASTTSASRVLVIGDSFVEGPQVKSSKTFTRITETLLSKEDPKVEILNAGISGSNTAYQYILWKHYLRSTIKADILLLCLYLGDDLAQNHPELNSQYLKRVMDESYFFINELGEVQHIAKSRSPLLLFLRSLTDHSRVLHFLYKRFSEVKKYALQTMNDKSKTLIHQRAMQTTSSLKPYWDESIHGTLALIHRWKQEVEKEGIQFGIMIIPSSNSLGNEGYAHVSLDGFVALLKGWSQKENVPLLEINLDGRNPYELYSFDGVTLGHFSPEGHTQTAKQLASWIKEELLLQINTSGRST